jgi:hypothetical protein
MMFIFAPILATLAFVVANANLIAHEHRANAAATCTATDNFIFISYAVYIPVPFVGSDTCDGLYNLLYWGQWPLSSIGADPAAVTNITTVIITSWQCIQATDGNTQLYFDAPPGGSGSVLSTDLALPFPGINGFNCPDS